MKNNRGISMMVFLLALFAIAMLGAVVMTTARIAKQQTLLLQESHRQERCREVLRRVDEVLLLPAGYPRTPQPLYPWSLPCPSKDYCRNDTVRIDDRYDVRAVPVASGYLVYVWEGDVRICQGDLYVPSVW